MNSPLITQQDPPRRYVLPVTPRVAWSPEPSRRRTRIGVVALLAILALQAVVTLRLDNTVSRGEALSLYLGHLSSGGGTLDKYAASLSGSPYLYPKLAASIDSAFGLVGARALSLALMLGVTALIYGITKRLFGLRPALLAAFCYAVVEPTTFLGHLATPDAPALFLLTAAVWLGVRFAGKGVTAVLTAAPLCVLAFAVNYPSGIFLPSVVALSVVFAWPRKGFARALGRGAALAAVIGAGIGLFSVAGGASDGVRFTTTGGDAAFDAAGNALWQSAQYGGIYVLIAVFGAVMFVRKGNLVETPGGTDAGPAPGVRAAMGLVMVASALLVLLYQVNLHTIAALTGHLGYGMTFAAPMVGLGMTRLLGAHFRSPQFPIAAWLALFALGYGQAAAAFTSWPYSTAMVRLVEPELTSKGHYLSSAPEVVVYTVGADKTDPAQWTGTEGFADTKAVARGYYDLIVLDSGVEPEVNARILEGIGAGGHYRLRARYRYDYGPIKGDYRIWVKVS